MLTDPGLIMQAHSPAAARIPELVDDPAGDGTGLAEVDVHGGLARGRHREPGAGAAGVAGVQGQGLLLDVELEPALGIGADLVVLAAAEGHDLDQGVGDGRVPARGPIAHDSA